jgi:hypothetical protein
MVAEGCSLTAELRELVCMERRIQTLDDDSAASLAISYLEDDQGVTLVDMASLILAGWNRLNVGALISFARAISVTHPEFLEMVNGPRFQGAFTKSWVSAFPELPASRALVARRERGKTEYEKALRSGKAESAELQLLRIAAVKADNVAAFAATLGARDPNLCVFRFACPELPVWNVLDSDRMTLVNIVFAMGAQAIVRLLLGFFEIVPDGDSRTGRVRSVGSWLTTATALQLDVPFRWLLGTANETNLDDAVELICDRRFVGALCEVEATGFDLTRARPARALARWSRTVSLVTIPTPSFPSVPASRLLAWHVGALRHWDIPCDEPEALASGRFTWANLEAQGDLSSFARATAKRVLFLAQLQGGVVLGFFANCPVSVDGGGRDPALKSAIFVLEHPTGEQRKWRLQNPNYPSRVDETFVWFGTGLFVYAVGGLLMRSAPEFGITEVDASFVSLKPAGDGGWFFARIDRWELWSV